MSNIVRPQFNQPLRHKAPIFNQVTDVNGWTSPDGDECTLLRLRVGNYNKFHVAIPFELIGKDDINIGDYVHVRLPDITPKPSFFLPELGGAFYLVKAYQKKEGDVVPLRQLNR